ncbi:hypothetical protein APHCR_0322 [Anaplasma phagocytophilum str. CR1007]|nr:hypothetical protein APHCR_0322 [Anaplasma phagocytophilum str. CR1007]
MSAILGYARRYGIVSNDTNFSITHTTLLVTCFTEELHG